MIELLKCNPFAEAMLYYSAKANDRQVKKELAEKIKLNPKNKTALEAAAQPAVALEKLLDSKLKADKRLVNKFFKDIETRNSDSPFGFCLAYIMVFSPLMHNLEYSVDAFCRYLRERNVQERISALSFALAEVGEAFQKSENSITEFAQRVEASQLSYENKWRIINAAFDYQNHLEELISLIMPAAKLIEGAESGYKNAIDEFCSRNKGFEPQQLLKIYFGNKVEHVGSIKLAPMILCFHRGVVTLHNGSDSGEANFNSKYAESVNTFSDFTGEILLGIGRHIINESETKRTVVLSEKMQILADSTRLEILFYLCSHRAYGKQLCNKFNLQRSTLSYHVTKLFSAGFLTAEICGGKTYYTADKTGIQRMIDAFAEKIK